jgi:hypothetical protein
MVRRLITLTLCLLAALPCGASTFLEHKSLHVIAGASIGLVAAKYDHPKTGIALAFGVGMAKEWFDERGHESYASRRRDVLITGLPAVITVRIKWGK